MKFIYPSHLSMVQKEQIFDLWNKEYPFGVRYRNLSDFEVYLESLIEKSHILLLNEKEQVVGWYVDFYREQERWFAMILDENYQGKGWGKAILELAKEKENNLNAWVIDHKRDKKANGQSYKSPLGFYLKIGFRLMADTRLEHHNISAVKISWTK